MTQHHCCDAYHKGKRIPHSIEQELQGLYKTGFKQGTTQGNEKEIIQSYQIDPVFVPPLYSFMIVHSIFAKNCLGVKAGSFFLKSGF